MTHRHDDHLPPPPEKSPKGTSPSLEPKPMSGATVRWGDRALFGVLGLLAGFVASYLYLDQAPKPHAAAEPQDPHAGMNLAGGPAGAVRDMPDANAAPPISQDPARRQRLAEAQARLDASPNDYRLLVDLGNAAYDVDDNRLAIDSYEKALKVKSDDPEVSNVLTDLGVSYRKMNDVDKALACFDKALAKDPKHWQALFNTVIVYGIDKNDKPKAREVLSKLKKAQPGNPAVDRLEALLEGKAPSTGSVRGLDPGGSADPAGA